ncbi:translation initiation factor IF-2 [Holospora undulata]|uniref:Translation initiation factor IF-2 n=1 Tax=Holospora undulata HU1 TaxID=1321371 RepID=A0A061JFR0_9PROT|nr:translation initiation factor IF-2 [Holospora undulata]ETZ04521.1 translation initiation factor IF-2 [Holospora undulata HU1]
MTEERKDKKRKPLGLNVGQPQPNPAGKESVKQTFVQGKTKRVTVEVRRGSRAASDRRPGGTFEKFTDEEQLRRLRAVQQSLQEKEEAELLRIAKEQADKERKELEAQEEQARIKSAQEEQERMSAAQKLSGVSLDQNIEGLLKSEVPSLDSSSESTLEENSSKSTAEEKKRKAGSDRPLERSDASKVKRSKTESEEAVRPFAKRSKQKYEKISTPVTPLTLEDDFISTLEETESSFKRGNVHRSKTSRIKREKKVPSVVLRCIELTGPIVLQDLAEKMAIKAHKVVQLLENFGKSTTVHSVLDVETAELIISEMGHKSLRVGLEDLEARWWNVQGKTLEERPPVVTIMGHVDHGKTSLLDALRQTSVASGEKGGITQHIGAYQTRLSSGKQVTFIDTPGHEAFVRMRERGSAVTDIIVLVVAADDGVKTQTIEAIHHAKTSGVPVIVAINKIDKANAKPDIVRSELLNHGVVVEKMGGEVLDVEVSALTKKNLDVLIETILLQAEMMELTCSPDTKARGTIIESHMRKGHGHVATVLIQNGTLRKGDIFVAGMLSGKVRMMFDAQGCVVQRATPGQPVEVLGFSHSPVSGERFLSLEQESQAREFVEWKKSQMLSGTEEPLSKLPETSHDLEQYFKSQNVKTLFLVINADVQGSIEGLTYELQKIHHGEVALQIISSEVGPVSESDVMLAKTSNAVILMFNTYVLPDVQKIIDREKVTVLSHQIVYRATEEVKALLVKLLSPEIQEHFLGKAEIIKVFHVKKASSIAGCLVKEGMLRRGEFVKIFRDKTMLFEGEIKSLRHVKNDMKEVKFGYECGMILEGFDAFEVGDRVECYEKRSIAREL